MESNYSGILSHVSSQLAKIPSSRSMLSRDKRLPLDTWNTPGLQENVFGNQFSTFVSSRDHHQGIHPCAPQRERGSVPQATGSRTFSARDDKQSRDTIPMPTFARSPSTMSSTIPGAFPQNSMVGPQRQQISELQFDTFRNPQSFLVWKIRFNQVTACSDFPSDAMLWIKEVEMVVSLEELKSTRSVCGKNFPNFEMLDAKIASALNKIIQNSQFKKKVTGAHDTVLDYAELFSVTLHDDNIQEFDTRWDKVLLSMSKIPSDDILESLYKLRIRESVQLKTVLVLSDMEIHQKFRCPIIKN